MWKKNLSNNNYNPPGIEQENEILPYNQMVYAQKRMRCILFTWILREKREPAVQLILPSRKTKKNEMWDKYLDLARELRKLWNMRLMMIIINIGVLGMAPKDTEKGTGRVRNWRTNRDHLNYSIVKISQNTEKSPGNRKGLAVTQWKTIRCAKFPKE